MRATDGETTRNGRPLALAGGLPPNELRRAHTGPARNPALEAAPPDDRHHAIKWVSVTCPRSRGHMTSLGRDYVIHKKIFRADLARLRDCNMSARYSTGWRWQCDQDRLSSLSR